MTKKISQDNDLLILEYEPELGFESFKDFLDTIDYYEKDDKAFILNRTFHIRKKNIILDEDIEGGDNDFPVSIIIGRLDKTKQYYELEKDVFNINHKVFFDKNIKIKIRHLCYEDSPVIGYLSRTIESDIYVDNDEGKDEENHISLTKFEECIAKMPTTYEIRRYKQKVTEQLFGDYFNSIPDYKSKYEKYVNKLRSVPDYQEKMPNAFYEYKIEEYESILAELKNMLTDRTLSEKQWQNKIIDIIKIVFPKYIYVFSSINIVSLGDKRQIDFLAIDNQGHVDVIEIKKAEIGNLLKLYRNNYSPARELSGSFTQVEKYIYYLSSDKEKLEKALNDSLSAKTGGLRIKIINPQGIIIAGRSNSMSVQEKNDFEIIKKAHKDIVDVITYDELITRLENTIMAFKNKQNSAVVENDDLPF